MVANHKLVVRKPQVILVLGIDWLGLCTENGFMRWPFRRESFGINHDPAFDLLNISILKMLENEGRILEQTEVGIHHPLQERSCSL